VNLGGVHSTEEGKSSIDSLGLDEGGIYDLDIFFAERHATASSLHVNLLGPDLCPISP
jgi:fibro-slime domain-containing protein